MSTPDDSKPDSKKCILSAAAALFAKLGLDKCSTREIAKQSDSNISLISYYFGGKEGLYKEVMREYALRTKSDVQGIVDSYENVNLTREIFREEMTKTVEQLIRSRLDNPDIAKILAREKLTGFPHSKEIHAEIFYPLIQKFYKLFETGQQRGFVKAEINPAVFFILISEAIWGFYVISECDIQITQDCKIEAVNPQIFRDQVINIFLTGVLK